MSEIWKFWVFAQSALKTYKLVSGQMMGAEHVKVSEEALRHSLRKNNFEAKIDKKRKAENNHIWLGQLTHLEGDQTHLACYPSQRLCDESIHTLRLIVSQKLSELRPSQNEDFKCFWLLKGGTLKSEIIREKYFW